ncbi:MAG: hypothetical protein RJA99_2419 [Pseudomonadota bacterium]
MKGISAQPETRRASEVLFDEVIESRNGARRENIRVLKAVCDQMEKDGVVLTLAEVVRRAAPNGPAYSTVSNQGSALGEYVRLRIAEQLAGLARAERRPVSLSDSLHDPVLQAQARDAEARVRWLTRENALLRNFLKTLRPGVDVDAALSQPMGVKGTATLVRTDPPPGDSRLAGALLKLIDHLVLERRYELAKGRLTVNQKIVLDRDQVDALKAASELNGAVWESRYSPRAQTH